MSLKDELYKETILEHYHCPRNFGALQDPSIVVEGINPLCGDELKLYINFDNDTIKDIKIEAKGCSISMASGSMMTESVLGLTKSKAVEFANNFKKMMLDKQDDFEFDEDHDELNALKGVKKYPVRIKCALLAWNTLLQSLEKKED